MSGYLAVIPTRVSGIPCLIGIEHYDRQAPDYGTWESDWDYYGYTECDWAVLDRRGRPADWLRRKLTRQDEEAIGELIDAYFEQKAQEDKDEIRIERYLSRAGS